MRRKIVVDSIAAILFSVILIFGTGAGVPLQQKHQQVYATSQVAPPTNKAPVPYVPVCNPNSPSLRLGSTGAKVVELQIFLTQLGYGPLLGKNGIDGRYAAPTLNAVKKFQQDVRLQPIDGKAGPKTWNALCTIISNRLQQQPAQQQPARPPLKNYIVRFLYADVFDHRDTSAGSGEWKLTAFVNDKQVYLDNCSPTRPGGSGIGCLMQHVESNKRIPLNVAVPISVGERGVILIRVGGVELDAESWKPATVPPEVKKVLSGIAWGIGVVAENPLAGPVAEAAVDRIDDIIALGGAVAGYFDNDDILGTVSINDPGPAFDRDFNEMSSRGDYALGVRIDPAG